MKRLILTTAIVLAVSACTPRFTDTYCTSYIPITYDGERDTQTTKAQIKEANAVWTRLCK